MSDSSPGLLLVDCARKLSSLHHFVHILQILSPLYESD
jgi:hypothetical protein